MGMVLYHSSQVVKRLIFLGFLVVLLMGVLLWGIGRLTGVMGRF